MRACLPVRLLIRSLTYFCLLTRGEHRPLRQHTRLWAVLFTSFRGPSGSSPVCGLFSSRPSGAPQAAHPSVGCSLHVLPGPLRQHTRLWAVLFTSFRGPSGSSPVCGLFSSRPSGAPQAAHPSVGCSLHVLPGPLRQHTRLWAVLHVLPGPLRQHTRLWAVLFTSFRDPSGSTPVCGLFSPRPSGAPQAAHPSVGCSLHVLPGPLRQHTRLWAVLHVLPGPLRQHTRLWAVLHVLPGPLRQHTRLWAVLHVLPGPLRQHTRLWAVLHVLPGPLRQHTRLWAVLFTSFRGPSGSTPVCGLFSSRPSGAPQAAHPSVGCSLHVLPGPLRQHTRLWAVLFTSFRGPSGSTPVCGLFSSRPSGAPHAAHPSVGCSLHVLPGPLRQHTRLWAVLFTSFRGPSGSTPVCGLFSSRPSGAPQAAHPSVGCSLHVLPGPLRQHTRLWAVLFTSFRGPSGSTPVCGLFFTSFRG